MIVRGSTPTLTFETDIKDTASEIKDCEITIESEKVNIKKSKSDMQFKDQMITCTLSENDTLLFEQNGDGKTRVPKPEPIFIQLKVTLNNGTVLISETLKSTVHALLGG